MKKVLAVTGIAKKRCMAATKRSVENNCGPKKKCKMDWVSEIHKVLKFNTSLLLCDRVTSNFVSAPLRDVGTGVVCVCVWGGLAHS